MRDNSKYMFLMIEKNEENEYDGEVENLNINLALPLSVADVKD